MSLNTDFVEPWLRQFAQEFVRNRTRDIYARGLTNTEALVRSLSAKVNADAPRGIYYCLVYFNTYGRYQDMRRRYTRAGGENMVEDLAEWAQKEGLQNFQKGRYAGVYQNQPSSRVLNAIAWGIIRKTKQKGFTKKRGWWNKGKTRDIENLYDVLLRAMKEEIPRQVAQIIQ